MPSYFRLVPTDPQPFAIELPSGIEVIANVPAFHHERIPQIDVETTNLPAKNAWAFRW